MTRFQGFGAAWAALVVVSCSASGGAGAADEAGGLDVADVAEAGSDPGVAGDPAAEAMPESVDTADPGGPWSATSPRFDPASDDFHATPWPSDARRAADGHWDLSGFPNPAAVPFLEKYLAFAGTVLDGASVAQVSYLAFDGPLDVSGLPQDGLAGSLDDPVFLFEAGEGGVAGVVPILWAWYPAATTYLPSNVLAIRPLWGFPLKAGAKYGVVVTSALKGIDGLAPRPPAAFVAALAGEGPWATALAPVRALVAAHPELAGRVTVATGFTVARPADDLARIRTWLRTSTEAPALTDVQWVEGTGDHDRYLAHYVAPDFLRGTPPYAAEGGGFEFDETGAPVLQRAETMRVVLTVPTGVDMPAGGWPIVLVAHGTGGSADSFVDSSMPYVPAVELSQEGLACAGIDQPLHGERMEPPLSGDLLDLYSYNFLNPESGRTLQRQSVIDEMTLLRMVEAGTLVIPGWVSASGRDERFDPSRILYFGHSQGGINGAVLFGVEDHLRGGLLSGAGAGIALTLMLRTVPMDLHAWLADLLWIDDPAELDQFHPVAALIQALVDPTDPVAYAGRFFQWAAGDSAAGPRSVLLSEGMQDTDTPPPTTEVLAATAGIPILAPFQHWPIGLSAKGIGPAALPAAANVACDGCGATGLLVQYPDHGHFACYQDADAVAYYREFLRSLADGGAHVGF